MPTPPPEYYHCIFCGQYYYDEGVFERHRIFEHDRAFIENDDRQMNYEEDDEDDRRDGLDPKDLHLTVMYPTWW
jgi:hypothetical protein